VSGRPFARRCSFTELCRSSMAVSHFWSLSVEEHFYLLWPALLVAFGVRRGADGAHCICRSASAPARKQVSSVQCLFQDGAHGNFHSDLIADSILWAACWLLYAPAAPRAERMELHHRRCGGGGSIRAVRVAHEQRDLLLNLMPTCSSGHRRGSACPIGRFLELPPLRYIGRLSYSLYLWQELFLSDPARHLRLPLALAASLHAHS